MEEARRFTIQFVIKVFFSTITYKNITNNINTYHKKKSLYYLKILTFRNT